VTGVQTCALPISRYFASIAGEREFSDGCPAVAEGGIMSEDYCSSDI
jgi:hypothetical protein